MFSSVVPLKNKHTKFDEWRKRRSRFVSMFTSYCLRSMIVCDLRDSFHVCRPLLSRVILLNIDYCHSWTCAYISHYFISGSKKKKKRRSDTGINTCTDSINLLCPMNRLIAIQCESLVFDIDKFDEWRDRCKHQHNLLVTTAINSIDSRNQPSRHTLTCDCHTLNFNGI
jgi:hypothetical protein